MSTNPHKTDLKEALPTGNVSKRYSLGISDNHVAKTGDRVIDIRSGMEGTLIFGLWYWSVTWEDNIETIVVDPSILKLK